MIVALYLIVVMIWGTTWLAVAFQSTNVSIPWEVSLFYRFLVAGVFQFLGMLILRRLHFIPLKDHIWLFLLGVFLFGVNYLFFYNSVAYVNSGLASIIFAMAILANLLNEFLFFRQRPSFQVMVSAFLGVVGIIFVFWDNLWAGATTQDEWLGVVLAIVGIYCFSIGNIISKKLQAAQHDLLSVNSYAFLYGCLILAGWNILIGRDFYIPYYDIRYMEGLLYLAIPGTVVGFGAYLYLVGKVNPSSASYATILYPIIALVLSSILNDFQWKKVAVFGVILIVAGNIILLLPKPVFARFFSFKLGIIVRKEV